jgi:carboxypeptidase C (cathepsin A)
VSDILRKVMATNPKMRILLASGYYDLATPYFAADYALDHLEISPALRQNLSVSYFHSGHMMYTHRPSLERLADELRHFVTS